MITKAPQDSLSSKNRPSVWLEKQHDDTDKALDAILAGGGAKDELLEALMLLKEHIYLEETLLFPLLADRAGLFMPQLVMKREHGSMWPLIEELLVWCKDEVIPIESPPNSLTTLRELLANHNAKEEQILYTETDRLADEEGTDAILNQLQAAKMPENWQCELAP